MSFNKNKGNYTDVKQQMSKNLDQINEYDSSQELQTDQREDESGFMEKKFQESELFTIRNFDMMGFQQKMKIFCPGENAILIVSENNQIWRFRFASDNQFIQYPLPEPKEGGVLDQFSGGLQDLGQKMLFMGQSQKESAYIQRMFMDEQSYHTIICTENWEYFYFNIKDTQIRQLTALNNRHYVKCIGWDPSATQESAKSMILGSDDGEIFIYKLEIKNGELIESPPSCVVKIPSKKQILNLELLGMDQEENNKGFIIIATTSSSIYCFYGSNELDILFSQYKDVEKIKKAEVPMQHSHTSIMAICFTKAKQRPHSFIWTNGNALIHYQFPDYNEKFTQAFLRCPNHYKYAQQQDSEEKEEYTVREMPIALGYSEFHYFLLHSDGLTILSRITEQVVQYIDLRTMSDMQGMCYDQANEAFWIFSSQQAIRLNISSEDRDAWKLYMQKKWYKEAYDICSQYDELSEYSDYIAGIYGDKLFTDGKYDQAARVYVSTSRSYEQIFIQFLNASRENPKIKYGLQTYLLEWLQKYGQNDQVHRTILISWLVELQVYRLNELEKQYNDSKSINQRQNELELMKKDLSDFLELHQQEFDQEMVKIIYQIMISHGRFQNCISFAEKKEEYEMIILHHINQENYSKALEYMEKLKDKRILDLLYKYGHIFMQHEPAETCKILKMRINSIQPTKLIGGLMNIPLKKRDIGIDFLRSCIEKGKSPQEKSIHNILIFFLTEPPRQDLLDHLYQQEKILKEKDKVYFNTDFALRLFERNQNYEAQIIIYGMMRFYSEAVSLALQYNLLDTAKEYASQTENDEVKKKLWMQIAKHYLNKSGNKIDEVMELIKASNILKIEDILPFFDQNIQIQHFQDEICSSLLSYNEDIENLKDQMENFSQNTQNLKNELRSIKNQFIQVDPNTQCHECVRNLFTEQFYIFPCLHGFHQECLKRRIQEQPHKLDFLNQIEVLQQEIDQYVDLINTANQKKYQEQNSFFSFANFLSRTFSQENDDLGINQDQERRLRETKEELDKKLASECIECGPSIVESIQLPFDYDETSKKSWSI